MQEREWLVDPGVEIPAEAAAIHGVSTERARAEGLDPATATAGIAEALAGFFDAGIPVMAFNAAYDFTVLANECARYGLQTPTATPVIDPFILDKQMDRYRRGKRTLVALCELYGVRLEARTRRQPTRWQPSESLMRSPAAIEDCASTPSNCTHGKSAGAHTGSQLSGMAAAHRSGSTGGRCLASTPDACGRIRFARPERAGALGTSVSTWVAV